MKFIILFCLYFLTTQKATDAFTEYYWRDYDGTIPCDAIQGGTDKYGYYTYIGQIAATDVCSPDIPDTVSATIYPGDLYGYAAYHSKVYKNKKHVKILCSYEQHKYRWARTLDANCELIRGSHTANYSNYYIGRSNYKGQNVTGRFSTDLLKLFVPWPETPNKLVELPTYDMLMYCQ